MSKVLHQGDEHSAMRTLIFTHTRRRITIGCRQRGGKAAAARRQIHHDPRA